MDINNVVIVGRLTRDAELKYTSAGTAVSKISIAVNRSIKKNGQWQKEASFFDVTLWGKTAESLQKFLTKGTQVGVQGELVQQRWEKDGQSRSKVEINCRTIQLLGSPKNSGSTASSTASNKPAEYFEDDISF